MHMNYIALIVYRAKGTSACIEILTEIVFVFFSQSDIDCNFVAGIGTSL